MQRRSTSEGKIVVARTWAPVALIALVGGVGCWLSRPELASDCPSGQDSECGAGESCYRNPYSDGALFICIPSAFAECLESDAGREACVEQYRSGALDLDAGADGVAAGSDLATDTPPTDSDPDEADAETDAFETGPEVGTDLVQVDATADVTSDPDQHDSQPACVDAVECQNALFCDGVERCVDGRCEPGEPPDLDDDWICTVDSCDEEADLILHLSEDAACGDPPECRAVRCDPAGENTTDGMGCVLYEAPLAAPCAEGVCRGEECVAAGCGNGVVEVAGDEECDDGNTRDGDGCSSLCRWEEREGAIPTEDPSQILIAGDEDGERWGQTIRCADVDGDNLDELILFSSDGTGETHDASAAPEVRVVYGPITPASGPVLDLEAVSAWVYFGQGNTAEVGADVQIGDLNGDGRADIVLSVPEDQGSLGRTGRVDVFYGADSLPASPDQSYLGAQRDQRLAAVSVTEIANPLSADLIFRSEHVDTGALLLRTEPSSGFDIIPDLAEQRWIQAEEGVGGLIGFPSVVAGELEPARAYLLVSDQGAAESPSDATPVGRAYLLDPARWPGSTAAIDEISAITFVGPPDSNGLRAGAFAPLTNAVRRSIVLVSPGDESNLGRVFVVDAESVGSSVEVHLSDPWLTGTETSDRVEVLRPLDLTLDGMPDLVLRSNGVCGAGVLSVFPFAVNLAVRDTLAEAPISLRGQCGDELATVAVCELDGDDRPEYVFGLPGAQMGRGLIVVLQALPLSVD